MSLRIEPNINCTHYDLQFSLNPYKESFTGISIISVVVTHSADTIILNARELRIESASWNDEPIESINYSGADQSIVIHRLIHKGEQAKLAIRYTGNFGNDMYGIFMSSYKDENKTVADAIGSLAINSLSGPIEPFFLCTQFQPIGARLAFPCVDDPAEKATFQLTLTYKKGFDTLSNTPVEELKTYEDRVTVRFKITPPMSTYMLAFLLGKLETISSTTTPISISTLPGGTKDALFALEVAEKSFNLFQELLDFKYPLDKLDLVAIPDNSRWALENFGLCTFREADLLVPKSSANRLRHKIVGGVVIHEIAHQWLGNLVTIQYWDSVWLKEGFTQWLSFYAMDKFFPEWKVWDDYVIFCQHKALLADSLSSSEPVATPIMSIADIEHSSDLNTNGKGFGLATMLADYLGADVFLTGVKTSIHKYAWENITPELLWKCFEEASGVPVEKYMKTWVHEPGFPKILVEEKQDKLVISQSRYLFADIRSSQLYPVPISIKSDDVVKRFLLDDKSIEIDRPQGVYKLNHKHKGFYVTAYPEGHWEKLSKVKFDVEDTVGIISDAGLCYMKQDISSDIFFPFIQSFSSETNPPVWESIFQNLSNTMDAYLFDETVWKQYFAFARDLISGHVSSCCDKFDDVETQRQNDLIFMFACFVEEPSVNEYCHKQYDKFMNGGQLETNRARIILQTVVRDAEENKWEKLLKRFVDEDNDYVRDDILFSLGSSRNTLLLNRLMEITISSGKVKKQDVPKVLSGMTTSAAGVDFLWTYLRRNWLLIKELLTEGSEIQIRSLYVATQGLCTLDHHHELISFFNSKNGDLYSSFIENRSCLILSRVQRSKTERDGLTQWFTRNQF